MKVFRSIGMMIGAIVGVGVFGLPYAFAQSGFIIGFGWLIVLGFLMIVLQLMFAEMAMETEGKDRLVGYVRRYAGPKFGWAATVAFLGVMWGAQIAYMIVGGEFLFQLLSPFFGGTPFAYAFVIAAVASALIFRGLRFAAKIETVVVCILLFLFSICILASIPFFNVENIFTYDQSSAFLPYGVILFAISGLGVIPEIKDLLGSRDYRLLPQIVAPAMGIIIILYALFSLAVVGVTGHETTPSALAGLSGVLGPGFGVVGSLLGSFTILSIFMMVGIENTNMLRSDFRLPTRTAWAAASFIPVLFFLLGVRQFIDVIGFVGSVFSGALGVFLVVAYYRMCRKRDKRKAVCAHFPRAVGWALVAVFSFGVVAECISFFRAVV